MANIMDLISSWGKTIENNQNISTPYMMYQVTIKVAALNNKIYHHDIYHAYIFTVQSPTE